MKKVIIGAVAVILIGGTLVFANTASNTESDICPDRPGCICSDRTAACSVAKQDAQTDNSSICPNRPGCICTK